MDFNDIVKGAIELATSGDLSALIIVLLIVIIPFEPSYIKAISEALRLNKINNVNINILQKKHEEEFTKIIKLKPKKINGDKK